MNKFINFSANIQNAFENDESKYLGFCDLMKAASTKNYEAGITDADANQMLREKFNMILGLDSNASAKEVRRQIKKNKDEIFAVIEDWIEDSLMSGWENNDFFKQFVDVRNLALGDANEFVVDELDSYLNVARLSGSSWDIDRQRLGEDRTFRVPTYWIGLGVYEEFERVMTGRADWAKLTQAIYTAVDNYVNEAIYEAFMSAGSKILPTSEQFYKTAVLDANTRDAFFQMVEDVQTANPASEVVILGTKSMLAKLSKLADVQWLSEQDKLDRRNLGRVGYMEGIRLVEIPQTFKKGDTTQKLVDPNVLLIMPVANDVKPIALVYEGNSEVKEVTDNTVNHDMTYEYKFLTKLGVQTIIGRYFGTWKSVRS